MALISTQAPTPSATTPAGALMIAAAKLPFVRDRRASALLRAAGAGTLVAGALTDYELGLWRKLPMRTHLALDGVAGALMTASALRCCAGPEPARAVGCLTRRSGSASSRAPRSPSARRRGPPTEGIPATPSHLSGEGLAAREPAAGGAPIAPPPRRDAGPVGHRARPAGVRRRARRAHRRRAGRCGRRADRR